eukprot:1749447-Alexandrium_andersonii.AAC.1
MSASLVGSEMCIRDRPQGPCFPPIPSPGQGRFALWGLLGPQPHPYGVSVSYTHLTLPTICSV